MTLTGLRYRNASVFAGTALVVPPTSAIALASGWSPLAVGTAIGVMTTVTVLVAPMWGALDDRRSWALSASAALAAVAALLLFAAAGLGFPSAMVVPALCVFGAASGGLDPLVSARIQRSGWVHALPRIRIFGAVGWAVGLVVASVLSIMGAGAAVYLAAAVAFVGVLVVEALAPVAARTSAPTTTRADGRGPVPLGLVLFVLAGLPVPVSAYSYLVYSSAELDVFAGAIGIPFLTLLVLAGLELPVFAAIGSRLEGRSLVAVSAAGLALLALSWLPSALGADVVARLLALMPYTGAVVLWSIAQVSVVPVFVPDSLAGSAHSAVSAATKAVSALLAGLGVGLVSSLVGERGAPVLLLATSVGGLLLLALSTTAFPSMRSARIPCRNDERKHHVNSDR